MTLDVVKLAKEAGILEEIELLESNQWRQDTIRELTRFTNLVLEEAARHFQKPEYPWLHGIADEIRKMKT